MTCSQLPSLHPASEASVMVTVAVLGATGSPDARAPGVTSPVAETVDGAKNIIVHAINGIANKLNFFFRIILFPFYKFIKSLNLSVKCGFNL